MPRIACPSCGARYDVAAGVIGAAGKNVRCARCGTVWLARPEPAEGEALLPQWPEPPPPKVRNLDDEPPPPPRRREAPPAPPPALPPVEDEPEMRPRARRGGAGAAIAWVVTLVLIAGAGYGAVRYPHAVIDAWPASARLYTMLGLAP
ncbi:zinc-ribbon domain-containing protein [Elioraea tepidiphila]|jgi:predicted Zn finger-like uncharacterized protein|uniref:zinc-ribbon domain-containing protein n=1 Tax=Elioraea tepidiphila TaxID=457934 RepID=UPI00036F950F|nr:zinc-ribbon domain-containing protein [Elioraea tepidiphila]